MSVFNDFQKAWAAKFPGCDLPQAWEEDVRANLAKHRHKVALLKEELEKEEFYVEYLERLLADVEKHRKRRSKEPSSEEHKVRDSSNNTTTTNINASSDGHVSRSSEKVDEGGGGTEVVQNGVVDDSGVDVDNKPKGVNGHSAENGDTSSTSSSSECNGTTHESAADGGGDEIQAAVLAELKCHAAGPGPAVVEESHSLPKGIPSVHLQQQQQQHQQNKCSPYVTVIKVNGYSRQDVGVQAGEGESPVLLPSLGPLNGVPEEVEVPAPQPPAKSDSSSSLNKSSTGGTNSPENPPTATTRKVPPKPPPKRTKRSISANSVSELSDFGSGDTPTPTPTSDIAVSELFRLRSNSNESHSKSFEPVSSSSSSGPLANGIKSGVDDRVNKSKSNPDFQLSTRSLNGSASGSSLKETPEESQLEHSCPESPAGVPSIGDAPVSKPGDPAPGVLHSEKGHNATTKPDFSGVASQLNGSLKMRQIMEDPTYSEGEYVTFSSDKSSEYDDHTMKSQASVQSGQSGYSSHSGLSDMDGVASSPVPPDSDSPKYSDYVNIDYFLRRKARLKHRSSQSQSESMTLDSDDEDDGSGLLLATLVSDPEEDCDKVDSGVTPASDDVFDIDSGVYSSSVESTSYIASSSTPSTPPQANRKAPLPSSSSQHEIVSPSSNAAPVLLPEDINGSSNKAEAERIAMYRCIISSILESETIYLECLTVLKQYMKALRATIGTSQPVMSQEDFSSIFFKIPELHELHDGFLEGVRNRTHNWDQKLTIGDHFKILASKLGVYASFLQNYPRAIETVRKCSTENVQFSEITKAIKLRSLKGQAMSLEDLLHKPVARVQKNALVLHDLLKYTPDSHPDHKTLKTALKMTQCFLNDFNMSAAESMFPAHDRAQRHLVKNSFIVELSEGHRKLRHLFLFNDVIVCAKYKASGREKFTFEVKWYIPLADILLPQEEDSKELRENSPANILSLKTQASTVRDQIYREERSNANKEKQRVSGRNIDKQRKKLAELEAQLVLASPNLAFRIGHKQGKIFTFFLSSDFERTQWIEAINNLQASAPPVSPNLTLYELQTWITTCRKFLKTNMGAFLLRSGKDDLLVGDLHIKIHSLQGLPRPADVFLSLEVDSYGHFFRKAKTKVCHNSVEPAWNQDFVIELEGSQSLRILCYEQHPQQGMLLRGKTTLELNRQWLTSQSQEKTVTVQEFLLIMTVKYVPGEMTLRRAPSAKPCGLFGVKINLVCKKEKRPIPFLITSCVREVERRGMSEIGIYRVSGSTSDVQKLKKTFETNAYEAEQLLKEVDIHSVTGLLKMYLRELPEALFTDELYPKFFDGFGQPDIEAKKSTLLLLFGSLPQVNQSIIAFLLNHMVRINEQEHHNKMSLHNLATVFGPTLLRPGTKADTSSPSDLLAAETIDVMAQAGILYYFLKKRSMGEPLMSGTTTE